LIDIDELECIAQAAFSPSLAGITAIDAEFAFHRNFRAAAALELIAEVRRLREALNTPLLTAQDAPIYGGVLCTEGASRDAAMSAFYAGALTVTVYYGEKRIYKSMAEFCAAHPKEKS
jgi:hypothetical protein